MTAIELAADKLELGHCVIINDCDQPCAKLLAVVTEVREDKVVAQYLTKDVSMKQCWSSNPKHVTPANWFGVRVLVTSAGVCCLNGGESKATYPDGKARKWQEYGVMTHAVKPEVLMQTIAVPFVE